MKKNYAICFVLALAACNLRAQEPASALLNVNNMEMQFTVFGDCKDNEALNACGLWLSGHDMESQMQTAFAGGYVWGNDFSTGPLAIYGYTNDEIRAAFNRIWLISRHELDVFLSQFDSSGEFHPQQGYEIPLDILEWPAHGPEPYPNDTIHIFDRYLAPFVDADSDGEYNPYHGDYPEIKGDQCAFFVFNTMSPTHFSAPLRCEIQGMAYAFYEPFDSVLNNTVFFNYKIFNRAHPLYDFRTSFWCDYKFDQEQRNYVGCNVSNNCFFGYDAHEIEEANSRPSNLVVTLLQGMSNYMYYQTLDTIQISGFPMGQFYFPPRSKWDWNEPLHYGGTGHAADPLALDLPCLYAFPGNSDPLHLGTNGIAPWGMYAETGWTDEGCGNNPGERKSIGTIAPVILDCNDYVELDLAMTIFQEKDAVWHLNEPIGHLQHCFDIGYTESGKPFAYYHAVEEHPTSPDIIIYPNPAASVITIESEGLQTIRIFNLMGQMIKAISVDGNAKVQIDVTGIPAGLYLVRAFDAKGNKKEGRFVK